MPPGVPQKQGQSGETRPKPYALAKHQVHAASGASSSPHVRRIAVSVVFSRLFHQSVDALVFESNLGFRQHKAQQDKQPRLLTFKHFW